MEAERQNFLKKNTKMNQKQYNKTLVLDELTSRQGTGEDYRG